MSDAGGRAGELLRRAWWVALAVFAGVLVHHAYRAPYYSGDTSQLVRGGVVLHQCLQGGAPRPCPGVTHFPPVQLLIAAAGASVGRSESQLYDLLAELNLFAFAAVAAVAWFAFRWSAASRRWLAVAVLGSSFLVNYAVTAFGEMLGVLFGVGLVLAAHRGRVALAALCTALVCLTKDVAAPLALVLGLASLPVLADESWRAWSRRNLRSGLLLVSGAAVGTGVTLWLNVLRFGTLTNAFLLEGRFRVSAPATWLSNYATILASPAGGLFLVAPMAMVVLVIAAWHGRSWPVLPQGAQRLAPLGFTLLVGVGLAGWFTPLGWWAWGARLSLPWLVPAVLLALLTAPERAFTGLGSVLLFVVSPLLVLNTAMLAAPERMFRYFESHVCPGALGSPENFACLRVQHWATGDGLAAHVAGALAQPAAQAMAALHLVLVVGALWQWRRDARA